MFLPHVNSCPWSMLPGSILSVRFYELGSGIVELHERQFLRAVNTNKTMSTS